MKNKDAYIAEIALQQISKFGFRKTTMQDVADAANISRQTLYNHVANKNDLLKLVAHHYFEDIIQRCETDLKQATSLSDVFDSFITHFIIDPRHAIKSIPEAEEFEAASNEIIGDEIQQATAQKAALVEKMITLYAADSVKADINTAQIAAFFCATATGIKATAETEEVLQMLCQTFKQSLMQLTANGKQAA
ncbi:MAG: TetR/AcrR family transcriptional regulator [Candidatus Puniceispirillaceae bacterium]